MPKAHPTSLDGVHRQKAVWLTAALVVLLTIGAAYFAFHRERGARDPVQAVDVAAPPASATVDNAGVDGEERPLAPRGESKPDARNLPKSPVDHPFEFIREVARAAYEGDGEAQYRVAKELDRCEVTLLLVRKASDPEAAIWNLPAGWTQSMKERAFAEYQRCSRLLRDDPFAELPQRPGGYTVGYWMSRATESGQPLALVEKAVSSLRAAAGEPDEAEGARTEARETLVKATLSGNPDALLLMGFMMRSGSNDSERELQGAAWMLAGCRAGADCGFDSAIVPIWMCYDGGDVRCQPGLDVETMLGMALSPAEFTQAHARYERISAALRAHDAEAIGAQLGF
jgi:hypothetical protein